MQGIINFPYFIRVYKTAFFWKKIRFMKRRKLFLKERRGYLYSEKMKLYKQTIDLMEKEEEKVLQSVLEDLYTLIEVDEIIFN